LEWIIGSFFDFDQKWNWIGEFETIHQWCLNDIGDEIGGLSA